MSGWKRKVASRWYLPGAPAKRTTSPNSSIARYEVPSRSFFSSSRGPTTGRPFGPGGSAPVPVPTCEIRDSTAISSSSALDPYVIYTLTCYIERCHHTRRFTSQARRPPEFGGPELRFRHAKTQSWTPPNIRSAGGLPQGSVPHLRGGRDRRTQRPPRRGDGGQPGIGERDARQARRAGLHRPRPLPRGPAHPRGNQGRHRDDPPPPPDRDLPRAGARVRLGRGPRGGGPPGALHLRAAGGADVAGARAAGVRSPRRPDPRPGRDPGREPHPAPPVGGGRQPGADQPHL